MITQPEGKREEPGDDIGIGALCLCKAAGSGAELQIQARDR